MNDCTYCKGTGGVKTCDDCGKKCMCKVCHESVRLCKTCAAEHKIQDDAMELAYKTSLNKNRFKSFFGWGRKKNKNIKTSSFEPLL